MADLILICFIALSAFVGMKRGFIKTIVGLASTLISLALTLLAYPVVSDLLHKLGVGEAITEIILGVISKNEQVNLGLGIMEKTAEASSVVVVNVISFIAVIILTKFVLALLIKSLNIITKLPVIKQANALLGMVVGFLSGILISYTLIGILAALNDNNVILSVKEHLDSSLIAVLMYRDNAITEVLSKFIR